ncbi:MAG TPA: hypothetical protein PKD20_00135 [Candidatus Saccharibacteria bacterium]|jgi:hypothetical protein|nr:hypothetical protein [Candidatus Saccharibacteria bacterium]HMT55264.1 hypothetical protein [Candidatus Saccharibacteria bacterium]
MEPGQPQVPEHTEQKSVPSSEISLSEQPNKENQPKSRKYRPWIIYIVVVYLFLAYGLAYGSFFSNLFLVLFVITPVQLFFYAISKPKKANPLAETQSQPTPESPQTNNKSTALIRAIIGGIILYYAFIFGAYVTFGIYLLQIEEWKSFSDPIPFVDTIHLVAISALFALIIYRRNTRKS